MDSPALMIGLEAISGQWSGSRPFHTAAVPGEALRSPVRCRQRITHNSRKWCSYLPTEAPINELQVLFAATKSPHYGWVPVGTRPTVTLS